MIACMIKTMDVFLLITVGCDRRYVEYKCGDVFCCAYCLEPVMMMLR